MAVLMLCYDEENNNRPVMVPAHVIAEGSMRYAGVDDALVIAEHGVSEAIGRINGRRAEIAQIDRDLRAGAEEDRHRHLQSKRRVLVDIIAHDERLLAECRAEAESHRAVLARRAVGVR